MQNIGNKTEYHIIHNLEDLGEVGYQLEDWIRRGCDVKLTAATTWNMFTSIGIEKAMQFNIHSGEICSKMLNVVDMAGCPTGVLPTNPLSLAFLHFCLHPQTLGKNILRLQWSSCEQWHTVRNNNLRLYKLEARYS